MAQTKIPANETKEQKAAREKREERWGELRKIMDRSPIWVESKDPEIAVRWVRKDDPNDITFHQTRFFEIVHEDMTPGAEKQFNTALPPQADGTYVHGDVILMKARRDDYEFLLERNLDLSRQQMNSGKERFKQQTSRDGFEVHQYKDY